MMDSPPVEIPPLNGLSPQETADLRLAKQLLEHPNWTARLVNVIGAPVDRALQMLPDGFTGLIHKAAHFSLSVALNTGLKTLATGPRPASNRLHRAMAAVSGGVGGLFGLAALPVELPVSTMIILRSIADVARSEGHDLDDPEIKLACLEVFALGGRTAKDSAAESAYWTIRAGLGQAMRDAARSLAQKTVSGKATPAVAKFLGALASRFGVIVSEEAAAKAVPILGAAGGAVINLYFTRHFQQMSRGHFIVKRLEKIHGREAVETAYKQLQT